MQTNTTTLHYQVRTKNPLGRHEKYRSTATRWSAACRDRRRVFDIRPSHRHEDTTEGAKHCCPTTARRETFKCHHRRRRRCRPSRTSVSRSPSSPFGAVRAARVWVDGQHVASRTGRAGDKSARAQNRYLEGQRGFYEKITSIRRRKNNRSSPSQPLPLLSDRSATFGRRKRARASAEEFDEQ